MLKKIHLDGLILDGPFRIGDVLESDAVKLALVDVGDAVVLAALARRYGRLQVVAESVRGIPALPCDATTKTSGRARYRLGPMLGQVLLIGAGT